MLSIDAMSLSYREIYKFLTGSIIPRPIAFITSLSENGNLNGAPFSYFNIISANPPLISISIQRLEGKRKDTSRNIIQNKEFVIHITDEENVKKVNITASHLGAEESEIELAGLTPVKSEKVGVQGVLEAKIRLECVLEDYIELGNKGMEPSCDLIIGRVIHYHIDSDLFDEKGRIDHQRLSAVSRLAGHDYAKVGEVFSLKRPK